MNATGEKGKEDYGQKTALGGTSSDQVAGLPFFELIERQIVRHLIRDKLGQISRTSDTTRRYKEEFGQSSWSNPGYSRGTRSLQSRTVCGRTLPRGEFGASVLEFASYFADHELDIAGRCDRFEIRAQ